MKLASFTVIALGLFVTRAAYAQIPDCPPGVKYEPGGGPARCAEANGSFSVGHNLYMFVRMPKPDGDTDNMCLVWMPGWLIHGRNEGITKYSHTGEAYYNYYDYDLDPAARTMTIVSLTGPDAVPHRVSIPVHTYDTPQRSWPCTEEQWALVEDRIYIRDTPRPLPSRPRPEPPPSWAIPGSNAPSAVNPCITVSGHRVPGCH
jgi:hypothetical protein